MMAFSLRAIVLSLSICLLTSCGLKGGLYLSDEQQKRAAEKQQQRAGEPEEEEAEASESSVPAEPLDQL